MDCDGDRTVTFDCSLASLANCAPPTFVMLLQAGGACTLPRGKTSSSVKGQYPRCRETNWRNRQWYACQQKQPVLGREWVLAGH